MMLAIENCRFLWKFESKDRMKLIANLGSITHSVRVGSYIRGSACKYYDMLKSKNCNLWVEAPELYNVLYGVE